MDFATEYFKISHERFLLSEGVGLAILENEFFSLCYSQDFGVIKTEKMLSFSVSLYNTNRNKWAKFIIQINKNKSKTISITNFYRFHLADIGLSDNKIQFIIIQHMKVCYNVWAQIRVDAGTCSTQWWNTKQHCF